MVVLNILQIYNVKTNKKEREDTHVTPM